MKYEYSEDDINKCKSFAEKTYKNHSPKGRNPNTIKTDIFIGKLCEIASYNMHLDAGHNVSEPSFINDKRGDGGTDLIVNRKRVDVKSIRKDWHRRVYFNPRGNWDIVESIVIHIPKNNEFKMYATYDGSLERNEVFKNRIRNENYFSRNTLKDMLNG